MADKKRGTASAVHKSQSLIGGAMILTAAMIVTKIIGVGNRVLQAPILDADGGGVYRQAYSFYLIVYSFALAGFPTAISKIIVDYRKQGRFNDIRRTVRVANVFFLLLGVLGTLILILFARVYSVYALKNPNVTLSIIAVAPSIVFSCLMCTHRGYYQGMRNMAPTAVSQIVESAVRCVVGLGGAYLIKGLLTDEYLRSGMVLGTAYGTFENAYVPILSVASAGAMLGVTVSTLAGWVYLLICRRRDAGSVTAEQYASSPEAREDKYLLRQLVVIGLPITFAVAAPQIVSLVSDLIIQRRLMSVMETAPAALFASHGGLLEEAGKAVFDRPGEIATFLAGCYGFGDAFFSLVPALTGSFNLSALPHVADSWVAGDLEATKRHMEITFKITALIAAPIGFGTAALGYPILHMVYGQKNPIEVAIASTMLSIMTAAAVFLAIYTAGNTMLNAVGRHDVPGKLLLAGGAINLLLTYILVGIPSVNIKGAPVGNLVGYIFIAVAGIYYLYKNTGIKIDVVGSLVKPLSAGAVSAAAALLAYQVQQHFLYHVVLQRVAAALAILFAAAVFLVAAGVMRIIKKEDVEAFRGNKKISKMINMLEKLRIVR